MRASALAAAHRPSEARRTLQALRQPFDPLSGGSAFLAFALQQETLADWAGVERVMRAPWRLSAQQAGLIPTRDRRWRAPWLATALARTGRMPEAQAVIAPTPLDCDPCLIARGRVAALAGDRAGADHWFGEAVARAPSLPQPRLEWGKALLEAGFPDAAATQFSRAARLAPRWADPLGYWGAASLAAGNPKAAIRRFRAAERLAPDWGRNQWLWGEALLRLDRPEEARGRFERASRLDLSVPERAAVRRRLA
jgi:tetratricopeptide (TPR) repeat protein